VKGLLPLACLCIALAAAGCGSGGGVATPTIPKARTFELAGLKTSGPFEPGKPTTISFFVRQPDGTPLTRYRRGSGPHTGIHLIFVNDDLTSIVHLHPPVSPNGRATAVITLPVPGSYRMVVDIYPDLPGQLRNFQLFKTVNVGRPGPHTAPPPFRSTVTVDGYRVALIGTPHLRAIEAAFMKVRVTRADGKPAPFTPWYGALAHAIFFHAGNLDYFHTHVCAPGATGCTSVFGGSTVTGSSSKPGDLTVGVLLPESGIWRLFLQFRSGGKVLTAPFTLHVG
jgi:hypothetical protein